MENNLNLRIDNVSTYIEGSLKGDLYKEFKIKLGYYPEDAMWKQQSNPHWDGLITTVCYNKQYCRCPIKKDGMHFPTGLVSKAISFFKEKDITYKIFDTRIKYPTGENRFTLSPTNTDGTPFNLYNYQKETIEKAVNSQRGIVKIATGGGKTRTAAGIITALNSSPTIFYVTSIDLLNQAVRDLEEVILQNGLPIKVGAVGGGKKEIKDVTVMTVQTAIRAVGEKYVKFDDEDENDNTDIENEKEDIANLIHSAKVTIFDECQHMSSETCQILSGHSLSARWRYGLSATPFRDKGDDILIESCFGKIICDIDASFLIENGFLVKPYITFVPIKNMKKEKLGPYPSVYKYAIVENEYRNQMIAGMAKNLTDLGRTVLILVTQIQHGEILESMIPNSVFMNGSSGKKVRIEHLDKIRSGHAPVTIASSIFDEGVDCKPLDALILAGGGKSPTRALQRIGRVIRQYIYPDGRKKENAFVYDFYDHQKYVSEHSMSRMRIYKRERNFEVTIQE